ncbi:MAG: hypothetical protein COB01_05785 [Lutibacter sp.]|nr:MAG: hypothetical protein COB01_05785 [Lutibacter sp.]
MRTTILRVFYPLFTLMIFFSFSGCDELEEILNTRTVIYSLEYSNVDMSGMYNSPSNNTMIDYLDADGNLIPVDLVAPRKTWTQAVFLSKGDRAEVRFNAAININSGTATLRINCDDCENDDLIYGNGTVKRVYNLSIMGVGELSFNVE